MLKITPCSIVMLEENGVRDQNHLTWLFHSLSEPASGGHSLASHWLQTSGLEVAAWYLHNPGFSSNRSLYNENNRWYFAVSIIFVLNNCYSILKFTCNGRIEKATSRRKFGNCKMDRKSEMTSMLTAAVLDTEHIVFSVLFVTSASTWPVKILLHALGKNWALGHPFPNPDVHIRITGKVRKKKGKKDTSTESNDIFIIC